MNRTLLNRLRLALVVCFIFVAALSARAATTLLPYYSGWLFFDDGYLPAFNWMQPGYDDGDWKYGNAQFGYGDGDESTFVNFGPDDEHKFITTYFRTYVYVSNPSQYGSIVLNLIRDDGAVVYVNGQEVFRNNLPDDNISYNTYALSGVIYSDETTPVTTTLSPSLFVEGYNLLAVEMHQFEAASPDLSFDLEVLGNTGGGAATVVRGPYLQIGTSSNIVVRWRTSSPTTTRVRYGTTAGNLTSSAINNSLVTDHEITLPNLGPNTKYFYDIGTTTAALAGDSTYFFTTAPVTGTIKPTRIWAIGDAGTGFFQQYQVRDAYVNFTGSRPTDVWLMLGDNAYYSGYDFEFQAYMFDVYPTLLRQNVAWSTMGNHEANQNQILSDGYAYYDIYTLPTAGQAGGVPSGTEHYYSFNYANIHFVCLDSQTAIYRQTNGAMAQWLRADLADTIADWTIVFFHHPPYTRGSHNSEGETDLIQMRQNIVPILESYGVDLVLAGHSHVYERSFLIDGFYGFMASANATNFIDHGDGRTNGTGAYVRPVGNAGARRGAVYIVDGSSGGQGTGGLLDHPAFFYSTHNVGSLVLDVTGKRLDAKFISGNGTVDDTFTMFKEAPPMMSIAKAGTNTVISWPTSLLNYQLEAKPTMQSMSWSPANGFASTNSGRKAVAVPAAQDKQFFRLRSVP
jgi:hypothetical protein